jgi:hypothetical protein
MNFIYLVKFFFRIKFGEKIQKSNINKKKNDFISIRGL